MKRKSGYIIVLSLLFISMLLSIPSRGQEKSDKGELDWTKLNAAFKGATFVRNTKTCLECHDDVHGKYMETVHGRAFGLNPKGSLEAANCEACHGPRSKHAEEPDQSLKFSVEQYSAVCMQCHQGGERMHWKTSLHKTAEVGCVSCHTVMEKKSQSALLAKTNQLELCSSCHKDVAAKMSRNSRHPVKEGKVDCSSCHNPHGAPGSGMLVKGNVNETCYSCHQEKRGPFLWEHAPARENCMTCHDPHGTNNKSLLVTQSATLCISCHQYGGHVNEYRYNRVSTPNGNGCVNCHISVHGSNHPSGTKLTR